MGVIRKDYYSGWHDLTIIVFHVEDYSIYESIALPSLFQNQASQLVKRRKYRRARSYIYGLPRICRTFVTISEQAPSFWPEKDRCVSNLCALVDYGLVTNGHDDESKARLYDHQGGEALTAFGCKGYRHVLR